MALGLAVGSVGAQCPPDGQTDPFACANLHANGGDSNQVDQVVPASGPAGTVVTITGSWLGGVDAVIENLWDAGNGVAFELADLDLRAICLWSFNSDHLDHANAAYHGPTAGVVQPNPYRPTE